MHFYSVIWGNTARNGALFATRNTVRILGDTFFTENTGPSIQVCLHVIMPIMCICIYT